MKNTYVLMSANSEPLDNAEKTRNDVKSVDCIEKMVTEDATEEDDVKTVDLQTETSADVVFYDLCNRENFIRICSTSDLRATTDGIIEALATTTKSTVSVMGNKGSGRKTAVKFAAYRLATGDCPKEFVDHKTAIYELDMTTISIQKEIFVSQIKFIMEHAKNKKVENLAIYFNDISKVGNTFVGEYKKLLSAATTEGFRIFKFIIVCDEEMCVDSDEDNELVSFLSTKSINYETKPENKVRRILRVLTPRIRDLENLHEVGFPEQYRELLLMLFYCRCIKDNIDYNEFLSAVDMVLTRVKLAGRKYVTRDDVREYYKSSLDIMDELPKEENLNTAIHESGHVLLGFSISKHYEIRGCTILVNKPEGIDGVTCLYSKYYNAYTEDDIIKYAAMLLAGRAAELEFKLISYNNFGSVFTSLSVSSGSGDDLMNATTFVRNWVMQSGAYAILGFNVFLDNYYSLPMTTRKKVDIVVRWLIGRAFRYARQVIKANKVFVRMLADHLLKNLVATPTEIRQIMEKSQKIK